jgi:hypothetical protein
MPKIDYNLASTRMETGGRIREISSAPLTVDTVAGSRIQTPEVNPNAANVKYDSVAIPQLQQDATGDAVTRTAFNIANAAFEYQDRKNELQAQDEVLNYMEEKRTQLTGGKDKDGNDIPGYYKLYGKEAVESFDSFREGLKTREQEFLQSLPEDVAKKALHKIRDITYSTTDNASRHLVKQEEVVRQDNVIRGMDNFFQESEVNPDYAFEQDPTTGKTRIDSFLGANTKSYEEFTKNKEAFTVGLFTRLRRKEGQDARQSFQNANSWFKAHKDQLPEDAQTKITSSLDVMESSAIAEAKAEQKKAEERARDNFEDGGGFIVENAMSTGKAGSQSVVDYVNHARELYKDNPGRGSRIVTEHLIASINEVARTSGIETAVTQFNDLITETEKNGTSIFPSLQSKEKIFNYVNKVLPNQVRQEGKARQAEADKEVLDIVYKNDESLGKAVEDGKVYLGSPAEVISVMPELTINASDSIAVRAAKRVATENAVLKSKAKYLDTKDTAIEKNKLEIMAMRDRGEAFSSKAEAENYLIKNGVYSTQDRKSLLDLHDDFDKQDSKAVHEYRNEVLTQVKNAFRGGDQFGKLMEKMASIKAGAKPSDILDDVKGMSPEEANLRSKIINISANTRMPSAKRAEAIQKVLQDTIQETGQKKLEDALKVKAIEARTKYYRNSSGSLIDSPVTTTTTADEHMQNLINTHIYGGVDPNSFTLMGVSNGR